MGGRRGGGGGGEAEGSLTRLPGACWRPSSTPAGIPLLYINYFGMKPAAAAAEAAYANKATHTLTFSGAIPAVGFKVFTVKKAISGRTARSAVAHIAKPNVQASSVSNGVYKVTFDQAGLACRRRPPSTLSYFHPFPSFPPLCHFLFFLGLPCVLSFLSFSLFSSTSWIKPAPVWLSLTR